ncbi:MAG TPA: hypothetical protein VN764_15730 [Polyangiaceae bacterium]|nr:hypothetical protein [Polyangiaceae bacterium]
MRRSTEMRRWLQLRLWPVQAELCKALLATTVGMAVLGCSGGEDPPDSLTYCDVEPVFVATCERCHGTPLQYGAPIELNNYDQVYQFRASIRSVVKSEYMPYLDSDISPPVEKLSETEKDLIVHWVDQGAPDCP